MLRMGNLVGPMVQGLSRSAPTGGPNIAWKSKCASRMYTSSNSPWRPGFLTLPRVYNGIQHGGCPNEAVTMLAPYLQTRGAVNSSLTRRGKMLSKNVKALSSQPQPAPKHALLMTTGLTYPELSGLLGPAENLFLLDLRNGFGRVKTFRASLRAIHDRPTGVKLHRVIKIFQPFDLMRVT